MIKMFYRYDQITYEIPYNKGSSLVDISSSPSFKLKLEYKNKCFKSMKFIYISKIRLVI